MKQGTATKKSGTIAYQLYERNDLTGKSTKKNPTMGVSVVSSRVVTTKEMADDINHASSATQSDVAAVLQAVGQRIAEALLSSFDALQRVSVCVVKKNPPIDGAGICESAVRIVASR